MVSLLVEAALALPQPVPQFNSLRPGSPSEVQLNAQATGYDDSPCEKWTGVPETDKDAEPPMKCGVLWYLHIPKTGGVSVEDMASKSGHVTGACIVHSFGDSALPYPLAPGFSMEPYHTPPRRFVPYSFTIVRSPYSRMISEFNWRALADPAKAADIKAKAAENADAQVTPDDIKAWIGTHGDLPAKCCVAMNSGWDKHVTGAKFRNVGDDGKTMHFPGFHAEAAKMLMEEADVSGIAVDTLSLDHGPSPDFAVHYAWLPSGRWGIECRGDGARLGILAAEIQSCGRLLDPTGAHQGSSSPDRSANHTEGCDRFYPTPRPPGAGRFLVARSRTGSGLCR